MKKAKLLFTTNLLPFPADNGASLKALNTLRYLSQTYEITLISFIRNSEELSHREQLLEFCRETNLITIRRSLFRNLYFMAKSLFTHKPFLIQRDYSIKMQTAIDESVKKNEYNLIYVDHLQMAQYFRSNKIPMILDQHNIESVLVQRYLISEKNLIKKTLIYFEHKKMKAYETQVCRKFDLVLTVSENDKKNLTALAVNNAASIPIGVDTKKFQPLPLYQNSKNIIFLGTMYWPPNIDAVQWFHNNIWPKVQNVYPEATLTIIGKRPPRSICRLASSNSIKVLGYVPDPVPLLRDCAVFIVPLRIGGGIRVKILTAMAWGLPVVSTSVGSEGIGCTDNKNILIRDNPDVFAQAVIALLKNKALRKSLAEDARKLIETTYDWKIIFAELDIVLRRIAAR